MVFIWDPRTGNMVHRLEGHKRYVTSCAFSDDNQLLATGSNDQTVIIWNIDSILEKEINVEQSQSRSKTKTSNGDQDFSSDKYVGEWSEADVVNWVVSLGFSKYAPIFRAHHIDGLELLHLTHDSLLMNLKIGLPVGPPFRLTNAFPTEPLGHRNKILRSIMTLKNPLWQQLAEDEQNNVRKPSEFCCPITHEVMSDPVLAAGKEIYKATNYLSPHCHLSPDGTTYEREAIQKWIFHGNCTSPMTNEILTNHTLTPNLNLRSLIHKYQSSFGIAP